MAWLSVLSMGLTLCTAAGVTLSFSGVLRLYLAVSRSRGGQGFDPGRLREEAVGPLRLVVIGFALAAISPLFTLWCVLVRPFSG